MNWTIFMIIAISLLSVSIITAIVITKKAKMRSNRIITPFNILFAGLFLTTFVLMIPVYYSLCSETQLRSLKTVLFAIQGTFRVFTIDAEASLILENITGSVGDIASVYSAFLSVLYVIAPIFTFGFLISFFKNASAYIQFLFQRRREMYVFSELNEKSLALATNIKNNHPKSAIIFTDVFDKNDEESYELIDRARELGSICFKKDILNVMLGIHCSDKPMYLFAIGSDESENIAQAMKLIQKYGNIPGSHLYVFSTKIESELMLTHNEDIAMKVRRINDVLSLINRSLYESGHELFDNALPTDDGEKKIHAVIVGLGKHGREMLKSLTWYCQMDGYRVEIDAYDKDELAEEKITMLCPELLSECYNGVYVPGEAQYSIKIHSGFDVETMTFADSIASLKDVTFAFVALGSDEENVKVSVNLRMFFERIGIKPVIKTVIYNPDEKAALTGVKNFGGKPYNIDCIGDLISSYSENVIIDSELENEALKRHLKWGKEPEFWRYEYNYRSSMASAIHMKARILCGIPGADKAEGELTDEEKAIIEVLEHRRWNAYMRAEGYIFSGSTEKSSRNDLAKMHHDLVDFSSLSEEEKRKDSRVGSK